MFHYQRVRATAGQEAPWLVYLEEAAESVESGPEAGEKETPEEEPMIPQIVDDLTLDAFAQTWGGQSFGPPYCSCFLSHTSIYCAGLGAERQEPILFPQNMFFSL